jgi:hypothetical protein
MFFELTLFNIFSGNRDEMVDLVEDFLEFRFHIFGYRKYGGLWGLILGTLNTKFQIPTSSDRRSLSVGL